MKNQKLYNIWFFVTRPFAIGGLLLLVAYWEIMYMLVKEFKDRRGE